jgi:hypothetical protein
MPWYEPGIDERWLLNNRPLVATAPQMAIYSAANTVL